MATYKVYLAALASFACIAGTAISSSRTLSDGERYDVQAVLAGSIHGVVYDADDPLKTVSNVRVAAVARDAGPPRLSFSDERGAFELSVPPGAYRLTVSKAGYFMSSGGLAGAMPGDVPIEVSTGQIVRDVRLALLHGASVTGHVISTSGKPVPEIAVAVVRRVMIGGRVSYVKVAGATTDEAGAYRIAGLRPGAYSICVIPPTSLSSTVASPASDFDAVWILQHPDAALRRPGLDPSDAVAFRPIFFPDNSDPIDSQLLSLTSGEERNSVDFTFHGVPVSSIRGRVIGPTGSPKGIKVSIERSTQFNSALLGVTTLSPDATVTATGEFTATNVTPGRYFLTAKQESTQTLWAELPISVPDQTQTVSILALQPLTTIRGRLAFRGSSRVDLSKASVRLVSRSDRPGAGTLIGEVRPDGEFVIVNAAPGVYQLAAHVLESPTWYVMSATIRNQDVLDSGLQVDSGVNTEDLRIEVVDHLQEVFGTVSDHNGRPVPWQVVAIAPRDPALRHPLSRWINQPVRSGPDGRYSIRGLAPGLYYIGLLGDSLLDQWPSSPAIESLLRTSIELSVTSATPKQADLIVR